MKKTSTGKTTKFISKNKRIIQLTAIFLLLVIFSLSVRFIANIYGFVAETIDTITWKFYVPYTIAVIIVLFLVIFEEYFFYNKKLKHIFLKILLLILLTIFITILLIVLFLIVANWNLFQTSVWMKTISIPGNFIQGFGSALTLLVLSIVILSIIILAEKFLRKKR